MTPLAKVKPKVAKRQEKDGKSKGRGAVATVQPDCPCGLSDTTEAPRCQKLKAMAMAYKIIPVSAVSCDSAFQSFMDGIPVDISFGFV